MAFIYFLLHCLSFKATAATAQEHGSSRNNSKRNNISNSRYHSIGNSRDGINNNINRFSCKK